jgi:hypothetical protein
MMKLFFFLSHKSDELDDAEKSSLFQLLSPPGGPQKVENTACACREDLMGERAAVGAHDHEAPSWRVGFVVCVGRRDPRQERGFHHRGPPGWRAPSSSTVGGHGPHQEHGLCCFGRGREQPPPGV